MAGLTDLPLHPASMIIGFVLCLVVLSILAVGLLFAGKTLLKKLSEWLLNRRGFEKLGQPKRVRPRNTPYDKWVESARASIPVYDCLHIDDVRAIGLEPWLEQGPGVKGLYLRLADYQVTDGRILEIPAGGATAPAHHLFEMGVYFLGGPGHTLIFNEAEEPCRIDWQNRSVLSIPLNSRYQHVNPGDAPVRLLAISSFPYVLNSFENLSFIKENPFRFSDRGTNDPVSTSDTTDDSRNRGFCDLIPDALEAELAERPERAQGVRNRYWTLAGNSMLDVNLSELDGGVAKHAHRGNSDATLLMLSGRGRFITWPDGGWHRKIQLEWREGTLIACPIYWYRQFLNPGKVPARNLTFSAASLVRKLGLRFLDQMENDLPEIRNIWKKQLKPRGVDPSGNG